MPKNNDPKCRAMTFGWGPPQGSIQRRAALSMRKELSSTGRSTRCMRGKGITSLIKKAFYPDYRFTGSGGADPRDGKGACGNKSAGMRMGRAVDAEMCAWIEALWTPRAKRSFPKLPLARKACKALIAGGLWPVASQVVVGAPGAGVATMIDAVCVDRKGNAVVCELKTGFHGYYERSSGKMKGTYQPYSNSPKNQHMIQLALSLSMFNTTFPSFRASRAIVLRTVQGGVHMYNLKQSFMDKSADALRTLSRLVAKNG